MNIFYLHHDPVICARQHNDRHVSKMIVETAQLLSTAHHELDGEPSILCYKRAHWNHPSAIWCRENTQNYLWLHSLLVELCVEYTYRFSDTLGRTKIHKTERDGIVGNLLIMPYEMRVGEFTEPPQCFGDYYDACAVENDSITAYRNYYNKAKQFDKAGKPMHVWSKRDIPEWFTIEESNYAIS
mgnify:FL=1|tara:strand:- start:478 stop:1029 length:552 start_codon:yes stop_codon:yes gene_type:complete